MHNLPDCHQLVELDDGTCHFRVDGPPNGRIILLIHGATIPAWEFDRIVPHFTEAGFRTMRADLYGHGYSDRPRTRYTPELFVRQLTQLLDALDVVEPVHVLGHSLGAAIGSRLAHQQPERFDRLILAAPLVNFMANLSASHLLRLPGVGEAITSAYVVPMLVRRRTRRYRGIEDGRFVNKFKSQLIKPGFGRALLSMLRSGALSDQRACYAALSTTQHDVLLMRGSHDDILPTHQYAVIKELLPHAIHFEIPNTTHSIFLTHPERVAPTAIEFFSADSLDLGFRQHPR